MRKPTENLKDAERPSQVADDLDRKTVGRREALSTIAKVAIGAAAVAVLGGAAYYVTMPTAPKVSEVRIGLPFPLSGPNANIGLDNKAIAEIFAERINKAGGIRSLGGAKLTLIFADTEGKPEVARAQTRRLITDEKVVALTDGVLSGNVLTQSDEAERARIPMVVCASSSTTLTERGFKYFFRVWSHDKLLARQQLEFLKELQAGKPDVKVKKVAVVTDNTLFGVEAGKWYKEANKDPTVGGYELVEDISFPVGTTDLTSEVLKLKAAGSDVLLTAITAVGDVILLQRTFKKHDFNFKLMFSSAGHLNPDYQKLGKDGWFPISRLPYSKDVLETKRWVKDWQDAYKAKTGNDLYSYPAAMHDCLKIVVDAIERAKSTDPEKIREAMVATNLRSDDIIVPYEGVRFDENGQNIHARPVFVQLLSDNEWHIVGPRAVAVYKPVFSQPTWSERDRGEFPAIQRY